MKMPPVLCCIVFLFVSMLSAVARQQGKPRVIVTTDGEIDDQSSMIRFLMYSSDYDVAGIVQVNGVQKDGHSKDKSQPLLVEITPDNTVVWALPLHQDIINISAVYSFRE